MIVIKALLTYLLTLEGYSVDLCLFQCGKHNFSQRKTQIISSAYPVPAIGSVMKRTWNVCDLEFQGHALIIIIIYITTFIFEILDTKTKL